MKSQNFTFSSYTQLYSYHTTKCFILFILVNKSKKASHQKNPYSVLVVNKGDIEKLRKLNKQAKKTKKVMFL